MILVVSWAFENNIVYFEIYFGCSKIVIVFWAVEKKLSLFEVYSGCACDCDSVLVY